MAEDLIAGLPPELAADQRMLARRQRIAEAMMQRAQQSPFQTQMAGRYAVPVSPLQGLAQMANAYAANQAGEQVDKGYADLGRRYNEGLSGALRDYQATATRDVQEPDTGAMTGTLDSQDAPMRTTQVQNDPRARVAQAMASPYAPIRELGKLDFAAALEREKPRVLTPGGTLVRADGSVIASAPALPKQATPKAPGSLRDRVVNDQTVQEELQPDGTWKELGRGPRFAKQVGPTIVQPASVTPITVVENGKTVVKDARSGKVLGDAPKSKTGAALPPTAVKMQNEMLEDIGLAGSITSDLSALDKQITDGKLKLGPVSNIANTVKNFAGSSDEGSRNYASFKSTLEKLRNDSLRLNKGVQTEGDAQRAWNELIANANDPAVVQQRLKEIQRINLRGADLKRLQLDQLRANYGIDPMDTGAAFNQQPAVGQGGASGTWEGPERRETPRAPASGRRVVDY